MERSRARVACEIKLDFISRSVEPVFQTGGELTDDTLPHGAPKFRQISLDMLRLAFRRAASDMRRAPLFGLFFCGLLCPVGVDIGAHLA